MGFKQCTKCGDVKPREAYCVRSASRDGLSNHCRRCKSDAHREWYSKNAEVARAIARKHYLANTEATKARAMEWQKANKEKSRESHRKHYLVAKDYYKEYGRRWRKDNRGAAREICMRYYKAAKQATPKWVDFKAIRKVYEAAARLAFEVDHIVPLQGKIVCGLHCAENLQLLCEEENIKKGNRWWPDMPTDPA